MRPRLPSAAATMAFLFGGRGRQKQPAEIARSLKDLLAKLAEPNPSPKVSEVIEPHRIVGSQ